MYLTDRAGAILRHHTRSSQEGHHTVKRTGVPKAMAAAAEQQVRAQSLASPSPSPPPQTSPQGDANFGVAGHEGGALPADNTLRHEGKTSHQRPDLICLSLFMPAI